MGGRVYLDFCKLWHCLFSDVSFLMLSLSSLPTEKKSDVLFHRFCPILPYSILRSFLPNSMVGYMGGALRLRPDCRFGVALKYPAASHRSWHTWSMILLCNVFSTFLKISYLDFTRHFEDVQCECWKWSKVTSFNWIKLNLKGLKVKFM